jgi:hypothetical protein
MFTPTRFFTMWRTPVVLLLALNLQLNAGTNLWRGATPEAVADILLGGAICAIALLRRRYARR